MPGSVIPPGAAAVALGAGGVLPFAAGAWLAWMPSAAPALGLPAGLDPRFVLAAYGAAIVSFLGGIHWGLAMRGAAPAARHLAWGVTPSLLAWGALLLPPGPGLSLLAASLVACLAVDRHLYPAAGAGGWLVLRWPLTLAAVASCVAAAFAPAFVPAVAPALAPG